MRAESEILCKEMAGLKNQRRNQETCSGPTSKLIMVERGPAEATKDGQELPHRSNDQKI